MASFPALPSGNNPYAATAAGYSASAASVFNAIRAAANQHQQQKAAADAQAARQAVTDRQEYAKETQSLSKDGFVPRTVTNPGTPLDGMPDEDAGKQVPNPAMSASDQNMGEFHTDSKGNEWLPPKKLDETNSIPLNDELRAEAKRYNIDLPAGDARAPLTLIDKLHTAAQLHKLENPEAPAETFEYDDKNFVDPQTGQRVLTMKGNRGTVKRAVLPQGGPQQGGGKPGGAFDGQSAAPAPVPAGDSPFSMMDYLTKNPIGPPAEVLNGLPAGDHTFENGQTWRKGHDGTLTDRTAPAAGASGGLSFSPPDKADKPDVSQIIPGQQGPKGGMLIYDKNDQSVKEIPLPKGSRGVLTADQQDRSQDRKVREREIDEAAATRKSGEDQRKVDLQQVRENQAAKDHEAAGIKKQSMQSMAQGFHDAAGTNAGENYFPPRYVNGIVVAGPVQRMPTDPAQLDERRKQLETAAAGFEKTAKTHQAEQERIEKAHGWGRFAPASGQGAGSSGQSVAAQPVAQPVPKAKAQQPPLQPLAQPASAVGPGRSGTQAKAAPAATGPVEGTIIRNKTTGARQVLRGGQWKPL